MKDNKDKREAQKSTLGKVLKRIKKYNPNAANVDEHHWVRPFPQTFLDAIENKTEFTQNTGYK